MPITKASCGRYRLPRFTWIQHEASVDLSGQLFFGMGVLGVVKTITNILNQKPEQNVLLYRNLKGDNSIFSTDITSWQQVKENYGVNNDMSKRLYLTLFLSLIILLFGYYCAYLLTDFWTIRICQIVSIIISGFFIIGFNYKNFPKKHNVSVRLILAVPIIIGVCGLIMLNHFIPYLLHGLLDWEWQGDIRPKEESPLRFIFLLVVWVFMEEIYFRRIITQEIFNAKGLSKALWISALVFSITHWFSTEGLLYIFLGGLVLGYIYLQTNSIWMSIFAHLTYNLLIFFISPKITEQISHFNSTLSIFSFILLGFLMLLSMVFLLKYLTKDEMLKKKPVANN